MNAVTQHIRSNPAYQAVAAFLEQEGVSFQVEHGAKHVKLEFTVCGRRCVHTISGSPGDRRTPLNAVHDVRKMVEEARLEAALTAPTRFTFEGLPLRTVENDGTTWFVAADICRAIGINNSRDAISRIDVDDKGVGTTDTPGGQQQMTVVTEAGLYALIFESRKPQAKRFKKWVFSEVLPQIRRTGAYVQAGSDVAQLIVDLSARIEALEGQVAGRLAGPRDDDVTAGQVLEYSGVEVPLRARRSVALRVSQALRRHCAEVGALVRVANVGLSSAYLFPFSAACSWLDGTGSQRISEWAARGQA